MKLSGKVYGAAELSRALQSLSQMPGLDDALRKGAEDVRSEAVASLRDGIPPDSRTGALAASVEIITGTEPLTYQVSTPLDYGWFLEVGSLSRRAHPWLAPAFERRLPAVLSRVRELLRAIGRRAG